MDADGDWASGANPTGVIKAVPNAHAVTGFGNTIMRRAMIRGKWVLRTLWIIRLQKIQPKPSI